MADEKGSKKKDRGTDGRFVAGNRYGFKKGVSGNPDGRPPKNALLKEIDTELGEIPRETLYKVLDQATNGTRHFKAKSAVGKAINRMSMYEVIQISTYLDEQSNGKAKARTEIEGAVILLSEDADRL